MKALLTTLMMAAACPLALASTDFKNVPPPLQKALHGNALKSAHMEDGVLRLLAAPQFKIDAVNSPQLRRLSEEPAIDLHREPHFQILNCQHLLLRIDGGAGRRVCHDVDLRDGEHREL